MTSCCGGTSVIFRDVAFSRPERYGGGGPPSPPGEERRFIYGGQSSPRTDVILNMDTKWSRPVDGASAESIRRGTAHAEVSPVPHRP